MPKLKPATQRARREHILDAAEICFARAGFHRTTMQDICKEAQVSPGALYVYFPSKEDLIAGLAERDRSDFAERFAEVSAAPDFMQALSKLGDHYFHDEPAHKRTMCLEIGLEVDPQSARR
ncbi:MAG: TetR/AcrR family transcriptional regulator [Hyphomicrobium sp.]|nr:TetR/AcrR family transcriptional regulator [Hyphomicrobium sp.]